LQSVLENADYRAAGERIIYGNLADRGLLEERHSLKERMKRLEDKKEKMNAQLQRSDARTTDLEHHVQVLTLASKGYRKIRHRFLEVYR
jgi:hypothetical protein